MFAALILLQIFVLPIVLVSAYESHRKRLVTFFSTSLGLLGVVLVLLGSIVMIPYTATETFNNGPHGYVVWADDSFTLQPHTNKYYEIDLIRENHTLAYIKVKETTNPIFFEIKGPQGYGYGGNFNRIIIKQYVPSIEGPESPFEYFWTPPRRYVWDFTFENPHDNATNVTVKIICYNYNAEWQEKVTRYTPAINPNFAYVGIASVIAGIGLNLYETRRYEKKQKSHVAFFSVSFGLLGVVLALLGSMVMVPYTTTETFNNRPHGYTVWADDSFTLQPHTDRYYVLDLISENHTLAYVKVDKATNPMFFEISYGWDPSLTIVKQYVPSIEWPESPFEYFWTPPSHSGWRFIFENPYETTTNVTVKIVCYNYNTDWQEKVTRYTPAIHPNFAYVGVVAIIAGMGPGLYGIRRCEKKQRSIH